MEQENIEAYANAHCRMPKTVEKITMRWGLVGRIIWAWVLTIPVTALLGYWFYRAPLRRAGQPIQLAEHLFRLRPCQKGGRS